MDTDAALTLLSFASFFLLVATWIVAPLRAPAPKSLSKPAQPAAAGA